VAGRSGTRPARAAFHRGPLFLRGLFRLGCLGRRGAVMVHAATSFEAQGERRGDGQVRFRPMAVLATAVVVLVLLASLTWQQIRTWKDPVTFWTHIFHVDPTSVAAIQLAEALYKQQRYPEMTHLLHNALDVDPNNSNIVVLLGMAAIRQQKYPDAATHYRQAITLGANTAETHYDLGLALASQGDTRGALDEFRIAAQIKPITEASATLARILAR
jgi:cytochrome c-type biogenesis protein CcmH/NrfG